MQREEYSPIYNHQPIPDFVEIIKKPKNIADMLRIAASYIEKGIDVDDLKKELEEERIIKNIAIEIIKEHNLQDEMNSKCNEILNETNGEYIMEE